MICAYGYRCCRRLMLAGCIAAMVVLGMVGSASASVPVKYKGEGCVVGGVLYSLYQGQRAYEMTMPQGFSVRPYEGKKVVLEGQLAPSDIFTPKDKTLPVLGVCDPASLKLIRGK